jgi:replication-associated recombination protein RarA
MRMHIEPVRKLLTSRNPHSGLSGGGSPGLTMAAFIITNEKETKMGIANTINGLGPFEVISAIQKYIRRGMEAEAFELACEMIETSKGYTTWLFNRLQVISHEDIGLANPQLLILVATCCEQADRLYKPDKTGPVKMIVGTMIRAMCRSPKSREGDHFMGIAMRHKRQGVATEIQEWTHDHHSHKGRKAGRGVDYFREVSTQLIPGQAEPDQYEELFYAELKLKFGTESNEPEPKAGRDGRRLF